MYLTYNELMKLSTMKECKIVAGKNGLQRLIGWVHILDEADIEQWIRPDMLVIRTGVSRKNGEELLKNVIKALYEKQAAGLCLLPGGYYIDSIPQSVKDTANFYNMPIIQLTPYHFLADITYQVAEKIFDNNKIAKQISELLNDIIKNDPSENDFLELERFGFMRGCDLQIGEIKFITNQENDHFDERLMDSIKNTMLEYLKQELKSVGCTLLYTFEARQTATILMQWKFSGRQRQREILQRIQKKMGQFIGKNHYLIGFGSDVASLKDLFKSYQEAKNMVNFALRTGVKDKIQYYDELGIIRLLLNIERDELKRYVFYYLGNIMDKQDLLLTLESFLINGGNYRITAEKLFIHISTLKYRIEKIEKLLHFDLRDYNIRNDLYDALRIWNFIK